MATEPVGRGRVRSDEVIAPGSDRVESCEHVVEAQEALLVVLPPVPPLGPVQLRQLDRERYLVDALPVLTAHTRQLAQCQAAQRIAAPFHGAQVQEIAEPHRGNRDQYPPAGMGGRGHGGRCLTSILSPSQAGTFFFFTRM